MEAAINFYPFHIGDYAAHTRNLSLMEDLAYRRLLDAYYLAERPLGGSAADVARAIGMRDHLEPVEYVLSQFFEQSEGGWINSRADLEIERYKGKSEQASRAGKASAERRSNARSTSVEDDATDVQPTMNHEPRTITHEPETQNTHVAVAPADADSVKTVFEFWKNTMTSPRSLLDDKRRKAIKSALKTGYTVEQMCDAITGCAKSDFHMGKNDRNTKFNGLDLILRNAEKIDQFIVIGRSPLIPSKGPRVYHDISGMDYEKGVDADGNF